MWPLDQLWVLGQKVFLLLVLVGAWARLTGRRPDRFFTELWTTGATQIDPPRDATPRGRTFVRLLAMGLLVSAVGWAGQVFQLGAPAVAAMMLGGPSTREIMACRQVIQGRTDPRAHLRCIYGGVVTEVPEGLHCSKHGLVLKDPR